MMALFCDMHFNAAGGPATDDRSAAFEQAILQLEAPDLVVINGDAVYGGWGDFCGYFSMFCKRRFSAMWQKVIGPLETAEVPYIYALGNHDRKHGVLGDNHR